MWPPGSRAAQRADSSTVNTAACSRCLVLDAERVEARQQCWGEVGTIGLLRSAEAGGGPAT